jgi:anti-sigma B factor antagonist
MLPSSTRIKNVMVLAPEGRFDAVSARAVEDWLETATRSGAAYVVVDMGGISFMDSTGLATLVRFMKECRKAGGDLCLADLQQPVRMIFELTRLDSAFSIYPTVDAAVESLTASGPA